MSKSRRSNILFFYCAYPVHHTFPVRVPVVPFLCRFNVVLFIMLNLFLHKYVWNICRWTLSNKHGPRLLPDFIIWVRRRVSYMYNIQTLLTLREHMGSPPMFWNCPCLFISVVFCVFFFFFLCHCSVFCSQCCPSLLGMSIRDYPFPHSWLCN